MPLATPSLLQSLPPIPSSPALARKNPSLLGHHSTSKSSSRRGFRMSAIARREDDYHATLRALNSRGRTPRKSLGQHYMLNSEVNEKLVAVANVREGDVVLEIGPGTGSLTNVLIKAGATVIAIEKDPHMAALVGERFAGVERFSVLHEDFTKCHIRSHIDSLMQRGASVNRGSRYAKVVSNIPFNISTDVVRHLLPMGDVFSEVVLLLQNETALRLVDAPLRTPEYRPINIFVKFYSVVMKIWFGARKRYVSSAVTSMEALRERHDPEYKFKVERSYFFPQPKVDAAVVAFKVKQAADYPPVASSKAFFSLINSAFSGKRKMLRRSLQHICTCHEVEEALTNVGLPVTARPAELTLDQFVQLHNLIVKEQSFRPLENK